MRRAYESTKSLEERMRGSKPILQIGGTQYKIFYSKDLHDKIYGFYANESEEREGKTKEKEIVNPEGTGEPCALG